MLYYLVIKREFSALSFLYVPLKQKIMKVWKLVILLFVSLQVKGQQVDLAIIAKIESNNNPKAINITDGGSRGTYQIHPTCLRDYNKQTKSTYTTTDLFNESINRKIAVWMFEVRIPALFKAYKIESTLENKLIAYNAGIGYLIRKKKIPATTLLYIEKYKKYKSI